MTNTRCTATIRVQNIRGGRRRHPRSCRFSIGRSCYIPKVYGLGDHWQSICVLFKLLCFAERRGEDADGLPGNRECRSHFGHVAFSLERRASPNLHSLRARRISGSDCYDRCGLQNRFGARRFSRTEHRGGRGWRLCTRTLRASSLSRRRDKGEAAACSDRMIRRAR